MILCRKPTFPRFSGSFQQDFEAKFGAAKPDRGSSWHLVSEGILDQNRVIPLWAG